MSTKQTEQPKTKPVQTRLPTTLIDRIDQQATDRSQTRSDRLADLIERGMEVEVLEKITKDHSTIMELLSVMHDKMLDIEAIAKGER